MFLFLKETYHSMTNFGYNRRTKRKFWTQKKSLSQKSGETKNGLSLDRPDSL